MFSPLALVFVFSFLMQAPVPTAGVGLKWTDLGNASIPQRAYNVYRMQGSCPLNLVMTQFALAGRAGPTNTTDGFTYTFVDTGLMPGQYSFVITATATGFAESPPSNCATATVGSPVPAPTTTLAAPTNLTVL